MSLISQCNLQNLILSIAIEAKEFHEKLFNRGFMVKKFEQIIFDL